jgi:hypothetical protein
MGARAHPTEPQRLTIAPMVGRDLDNDYQVGIVTRLRL